MSLVRSLHAWCGLLLSLALVVVGLSGAGLVFREQITRATVSEAAAPPPPASTYGPALDRFARERPAAIRSVKFSPAGLGVHRLYLADGKSAFIDAQGRSVQVWPQRGRFEDCLLSLHHELLVGRPGQLLIGLVGLAALGMVLSGLVIWAPTVKAFSLRLWPRSADRRDLLSAHRNLGVVLALLLLVQLPTGIGMAFPQAFRALVAAEAPPAPPAVADKPGQPARWSRIVDAAQARFPLATVRTARAPNDPGGPYVVGLQQAGDLNPEGSTAVYLTAEGQVVAISDERKLNAGARLADDLLGIHSGAYGGLAARIAVALTGIGLAMLGVFGAWSYLQHLRRRRPPAV
jgi:uncharacterized iron-regulated membrane protein